MTEPGDPVSKRYRELAREEPPAALDARILAKAGEALASPPAARNRPRWMIPVSIAAVLVLGIGVALRMQLEQPGIESSPPASSGEYPPPAASGEYPAPAPAAPEPPPAPKAESARQAQPAPPVAKPSMAPPPAAEQRARVERNVADAAKPLAKRLDAAPESHGEANAEKANPFADAPVAVQQAPAGMTAPSATLATPAAGPAPAPAAAAPATAPVAIAPQSAAQPPAQRAKRDAAERPAAAEGAAGKVKAVADPDPARELERIARLRAAGDHAAADRALEEFRRRHPDFRIPEAMWERVKPR